nr:replication protein A 70 kDa DNA-binding subunit B [Tanacetum cinerariifolium]
TPVVHNALFGTQLYINRLLPELLTFHQRYESRKEYDANQHKIMLVSQATKVVTPQEFMNGAVKKLESERVIYAIVHIIQYESGWAYISCKVCRKKVEPVAAKGPTTSRTKQTWWCSKHYSQEQELVEKYGTATSTYFPEELNGIIGKKFQFRIKFSEYNHNNNNHIYRCEKVTNDEEIIKYWKQDSEEDTEADNEEDVKDDSEDIMTTSAVAIKTKKVMDLILGRRLQLQTPISTGFGSSSGHSSGSEKKRRRTIEHSIVIDLSDSEFDTENDEQEPNAKKALVDVSAAKDVENDAEKDEEPK